jgi:hypothetical protein
MKLSNILEDVELFNKPDGVDDIINKLIDILQLHSANIKISFNPKNIEFYDGQTGVGVQSVKDNNLFYIFIKPNLNKADLIVTLSHEMFHVKQMVTGDLQMTLTPNGYHVVWQGEDLGVVKYNHNAPWEIQARAHERKFIHKLL